jgi:hypothetical protein
MYRDAGMTYWLVQAEAQMRKVQSTQMAPDAAALPAPNGMALRRTLRAARHVARSETG